MVGKAQRVCISPFLTDLYKNWQQAIMGYVKYGVNVASPTLAYDMVLLSFLKFGLDNMLDICYRCNYLIQILMQVVFFYNAKKCAEFVFNASANPTPERTYRIGPDVIRETDSQNHLGIFCDENVSTKQQVSDACVKLRSSYMNVVKNGLQLGRTLYKSVVLPRALYGCETWTNCTPSDMRLLERANSFCVKTCSVIVNIQVICTVI